MPIPPGVVGPRSEVPLAQPVRSRAREQAARSLRLQEGRGWLPHAAGRQAAGAQAAPPAPRPSSASSTNCGRSRWTPSASASISYISKFVDNLKAAKACQLMMWGAGWTADYPDGDNFMQLLYGPNAGQSNNGCYESQAFDAFYEKAQAMPGIRRSATACSSKCRARWKSTARGACTSRACATQLHPAVGQGLQEAPDPAWRVACTWTSSRAR